MKDYFEKEVRKFRKKFKKTFYYDINIFVGFFAIMLGLGVSILFLARVTGLNACMLFFLFQLASLLIHIWLLVEFKKN
jgi:hypothetical protein